MSSCHSFPSSLTSLCRVMMLWGGMVSLLRADWLDDIGHTQLAAELGAAMPTGAGIPLLQSEANNTADPPDYLPQAGGPGPFAGAGSYEGKTFHPESGQGVALGHAQAVSSFFYGTHTGVARGATEIHNYTANDFLTRLYANGITAPEVFPGRVQNHSWIGNADDSNVDTQLLRRLDFMINRDGVVVAVGLSNNPAFMAALLGNNYHALTVGVMSGQHSQTGTNTDGNGRMKPDLVVNLDLTSYATPAIAGSAAVLLQSAVASGNANAEKPQVIKAQLLAGASKKRLPQWQRDTNAEPYDDVFGAGELNLRNAYRIQQAGQQTYSPSVERAPRGWDFATASSSSARRYFFRVPAGSQANTFSAAITWHRTLTGVSFNSTLSDLSLRLYAADNFTVGSVISASTSSVDNVEHLFLYNLPAGQYALEVTSSASRQYGLAWEAQLGLGPQLAPRFENGQLFIDASDLDPQVSYTLESSPTLFAPWTEEQVFRTADTTPSFTHSWQDPAPSGDRKFYRLRWTPVR